MMLGLVFLILGAGLIALGTSGIRRGKGTQHNRSTGESRKLSASEARIQGWFHVVAGLAMWGVAGFVVWGI
jgi:hypothetical protein